MLCCLCLDNIVAAWWWLQ